jgi:hypothetical protein
VTEFLTTEELRDMTGARLARKQMAWLAERNVPFRYDGQRVKVLKVIAAEWDLLAARASQGPRLDLVR